MSTCFESRRRQRGEMMLEALVGVLITSVIGAGLAHVASRVMNSQRDAKVENLVVEQLRDTLQAKGVTLCEGSTVELPLPTGSTRVAVACEAASANISMAGVTRAVDVPKRVDLTVAAADLGSKGAAEGDPDLLVSTRQ